MDGLEHFAEGFPPSDDEWFDPNEIEEFGGFLEEDDAPEGDGTAEAGDETDQRGGEPHVAAAGDHESPEKNNRSLGASNAGHVKKAPEIASSPGAANSSVMGRVFATTKSGMDGSGLSVEEQKRIIYEVTKSSPFFLQQKKQDQKNTAIINSLKEKVSKLTDAQLADARKKVDKMLAELEASRDLSRTIAHIDCDAFYCSVEERDDPSLKSKPFAVAMQAANYEARKYGVRSGMAGFVAKALCPHIVILPGDMRKYVAASKEVKSVLLKYLSEETELSMASIDEAYCDITRYVKENNMTAAEVMQRIRQDVYDTTKLTVSSGIAPHKSLAKVASDINKPNGQFEVLPDREVVLNFARNLNIRKIPGIGAVAERFMHEVLGVEKVGDLGAKLPHLLLIWPNHIEWYCRIYLGLGSNVVVEHHDTKSVGSETTFRALGNVPELFSLLKGRCEAVAKELQEKHWKGRCATLVCKRADFQRFSRQQMLLTDVNSVDEIYPIVKNLLEKEFRANPSLKLRLIGARVTKLSGPGTDGGVLEEESKQKRIDDYVGEARAGSPGPVAAREEVSCPVCGQTFEADTANVVVVSHVNKCLDKGAQKSPTGNKRPRPGEGSSKGGQNKKRNSDSGQRSILGFFN